MSLKTKLYELAKDDSDLMVAINDVKTFYHMNVDERLRVTDPESYEKQKKNLSEIRESYSKKISNALVNIDLLEYVLNETLEDIADNGNIRFYPRTTDTSKITVC